MPTPETLHCPNCGAAVSSDSTKCEYCNARLATVACPNCYGMMFIGEKFCSHCGTVAQRTEAAGAPPLQCPKCSAGMKSIQVGSTHFLECESCEGMWVDVATLQQICEQKEQQAAIIGMPADPHPSPVHLDTSFHYLPCPVCKQLMNRINFARFSGVIVNVCKAHGTWFDKDELRRLVEFIRAGGLDKARARLHADEEAEHARRMAAGNAGIPESMRATVNEMWRTDSRETHSSSGSAILDVAGFIFELLK